MIEQFYDLSRPLLDADERALALCREQSARLEEIKDYTQLKMLKAFKDCRVGGSHLVGTTGYGMDDAGRGKLEEVFAVLTGSEAALFRHTLCPERIRSVWRCSVCCARETAWSPSRAVPTTRWPA